MGFSTMRPWLAGGILAVAMATAAYAQDDQAAFEARYTQLRTAMLAKDRSAAESLLAADYQSTDIRGETHTRSEVLDRMAQIPEGVDPPQNKVLKLTVAGDSAAVESQMTMHMKRPGEDGAEMKIDITVISDDTWVQRSGTWLLQKSVQKDMSVAKDGEVVFHQAI
ncbi:MAG: nuclear transport factor 2 family protein [Novosphingobium sp.]